MSDKNDTPMFREALHPSNLMPYGGDNDEITLKELYLIVWAGKWIIAGVTTLSGAIAVVVALLLPNIYTSNVLLAPVENTSAGIGSLMKQYGGLASLAGVSLPGSGSSDKAAIAKELLRSRAFITEFVETHEILPELMAAKSHDSVTGELLYDSRAYDIETRTWVRDVNPPRAPKPSLQEAFDAFTDILRITEDKDTGFVTVSIEHLSPTIAQSWVSWLIDDINQTMRDQDIAEANRSIEYLKQQVANTALAELQTVFYELIQRQTETIMLAQVRPEYVFKTLDPAVVPEEKSKPKRTLISIMGVVIGGVAGIVIVLLLNSSAAARNFFTRE